MNRNFSVLVLPETVPGRQMESHLRRGQNRWTRWLPMECRPHHGLRWAMLCLLTAFRLHPGRQKVMACRMTAPSPE